MDVDTKYKRWGWGAVIGLIGIILIAGLVVAVTMTSPKPEVASDDTSDTSLAAQIGGKNNTDSGDANNNGGTSEDSGDENNSGKGAENDGANADVNAGANNGSNDNNGGASNNSFSSSSSSNSMNTSNSDSSSSSSSSNSGKANSSDSSEQGNSVDLPKTGPESNVFSIFMIAIAGSLFAYNAYLFNKNK